ncbi:MAG TPA: hypothetical protein V6C58_02915 [Allocoleopsis sp.]
MKAKHGGAGRGQGRKPKYGEPTVPVVIRVPKSKVKEFRSFAAEKLEQYKITKNLKQ